MTMMFEINFTQLVEMKYTAFVEADNAIQARKKWSKKPFEYIFDDPIEGNVVEMTLNNVKPIEE